MAKVNITVTPKIGPNGSPIKFHDEGGGRYAPVVLTIAAGQTYATADKAVLVHSAGSDFYEHFGNRIIKGITADPICCTGVSTGVIHIHWLPASQTGRFFITGDGGSGAPGGPIDEVEVTNATALGAGVMTANAVIFW